MFLFVGLGNKGSKYQNNRHNTGFLLIDYLVKKYGFCIVRALYAASYIVRAPPENYPISSAEDGTHGGPQRPDNGLPLQPMLLQQAPHTSATPAPQTLKGRISTPLGS